MAGKYGLYWRLKIDGKWTWRPVSKQFLDAIENALDLYGIDLHTKYGPFKEES